MAICSHIYIYLNIYTSLKHKNALYFTCIYVYLCLYASIYVYLCICRCILACIWSRSMLGSALKQFRDVDIFGIIYSIM